jgi:hypothetical protein
MFSLLFGILIGLAVLACIVLFVKMVWLFLGNVFGCDACSDIGGGGCYNDSGLR